LRPLSNCGESTSRILLWVGGRANFEFVSKSFSSLTQGHTILLSRGSILVMKFTLILFPAYSEFLSEERADAVIAGGGQRARRLEAERHLLESSVYTQYKKAPTFW